MADVNARPPSVSSSTEQSSAEPLYQVKLLSALRNGDPAAIHPFLTEIGKDKRKSVDGDIDTGAAALHLAVRCGSVQTVALLLSHRAISPNGIHPPGSGTTPLHLAASLGRLDIVNLLLEQDNIDDSIRDSQGRTCRDVARSKDIVRAIDDSRSFLNASYRSLLRSYILSPPNSQPPQALITLLESPRAKFVDLSYLDNDTGASLLHEAAKRKDLRLIELAVRAGADVFVRNRKGKMAYEGVGKDDKVRVFLRQFANHDKTLIPNPTPLTEPPVLKGYLNKYTNVAKGYNTRWFVLKNGVLSYYRHQDDETIASRGSISMKNAVLHVSEKTKLEVHSSPTRANQHHGHGHGGSSGSGSGVQKWYMKANHPVEAHRWAEAIRNSIEWFKQREVVGGTATATDSDASSVGGDGRRQQRRRRSGESDESGFVVGGVNNALLVGAPVPPLMVQTGAPSRTSATIWRRTLSRADRDRDRNRNRNRDRDDQDSLAGSSSYAYVDSVDASPNLGSQSQSQSQRRGSYAESHAALGGDEAGGEEEEEEEEEEEGSSSSSAAAAAAGDSENKGPPHPHFELQGNAATAQLELSIQLLANLTSSLPPAPPTTPSSSLSSQPIQTQTQQQQQQQHTSEMHTALHESLLTTQSLLHSFLQMTHDREAWWGRKVRKEKRRQRFWEESLAVVVREGEDLERELRVRSRRRGSRVFGLGVGLGVGSGGGAGNTLTSGGGGGRRGVPSVIGLMPSSSSTGSVSGFLGHSQPSPVVEVQEPVTPGPAPRSATVDTLVALGPGPGDTIKQRPPKLPLPAQPQPQHRPQPQPQDSSGTIKQRSLQSQVDPHLTGTADADADGNANANNQDQAQAQDQEDQEEPDTDEEDEFFDAIESNNLPNLVVHQGLQSPANLSLSTRAAPSGVAGPRSPDADAVEVHPAGLLSLTLGLAGTTTTGLSSPSPSPSPSSLPRTLTLTLPQGINVLPYAGYAHLRTRLGISNDQRPSTSLWSVLKHSIGKDLTKISFPVFFNEPTSMLQRMAEDMEFSECLDVAAHEKDPLRRIAFVAAFAMSNYSSTIGRIAKPFNPMLSETFEYVRLDKQYRYVSEQVSHHPPISACWAESTAWHYYGEVDAQNKFMGKSFEIRPTGVAHADLLLSEEMAPGYPKAKGEASEGKVVEHYSWKKVTTNVSGFILGSPTIDHYGDMVITNHRTGDQCILTFKPRGWRGKDAYEISGRVIDAQGNVAYEIAGRWNSQLVAKKVGMGNGQLHPDISVTGPNSPSIAPEYILLWRNSEKPAGSPFNLTPFAITLNDCPRDTLRPFVCPTDCRLRPDQRAFELGKYELANDLKTAQEEKQRSMRKAREEGSIPPHKPRWFMAETDGDTGERVWNPVRTDDWTLEYWVERERVWKEGGGKAWTGVDDIFIEEPKVVTDLVMK